MPLDTNGYLDPDIQSWINKHRFDHALLFEVCERLNCLAQKHIFKINIHSEDAQEILVALLFIRALSAYQGSILLIERGMHIEAKILLRTFMELLFRIRAISKDLEVAKAYVLEDEIHRKKFINKFKMLKDSINLSEQNAKLDELKQSIEENIAANDIKATQTQWYAQKAGLEDYYNTAYSVFSSSVHANIRDIEESLVTDENGKIVSFTHGPNVGNLRHLLLAAGESMILILESISNLFGLNLETQLAELHSVIRDEFAANE